MTPPPLRRLAGGGYVVPGNRADLLAGCWPDGPPPVSVVIPYYREQCRLDLVLTGLALQTHPLRRLEVVVADDGSPYPPDVSAAGPELTVTVVRQTDRGFRAAAARNLGARVAGGQVLLFLDGDTVPSPGYVQALSRLPALLPDALVTGHRRHADLTGWRPDRLRRWLTGSADPPHEIPEPRWLADLHRDSANLLRLSRDSYRSVISAVLGCPAALFAELGGFEESFTAYGGEDWEFGYRALNAGAVLAHEPDAVAWHDGVDWGERHSGDPAAARAEKARETVALAAVIPGIAANSPADVVIALMAPPELAVAGARAYRAEPDWACVVPPDQPDVAAMSRCRIQVRVEAQTSVPSAGQLRRLVDRVAPGGLGRVVTTAPGRWTAVAVATAARRRSERWHTQLAAADLLGELFGAAEETVG